MVEERVRRVELHYVDIEPLIVNGRYVYHKINLNCPLVMKIILEDYIENVINNGNSK